MRRSAPPPGFPHRATLPEVWVEEVRKAVLSWSADNERHFPWRQTRDPFQLMLAEILLRRTQATRVTQPYSELVSRFPDPQSLANADPTEVRAMFRSLGLVKKADQLMAAARVIAQEHHGRVPHDLAGLLKLPGLGTYSARALLCMGFDEPLPMIDESSGRLLRRLLGLPAHRNAYGDRELLAIAKELLPVGSARRFNLGLLDLAALICRPAAPRCPSCPLRKLCSFARCAGGARSGS